MRLSEVTKDSANTYRATAIEYALIASLIAIALVTLLASVGKRLEPAHDAARPAASSSPTPDKTN